jgi:hypothetical protein
MIATMPQGIKHEIPQGYRLVGKLLFPEKIGVSQTTAQITPVNYALIQEGNTANTAISMNQMFNGQGNCWDLHQQVFASGLKGMDVRKFLPYLFRVNEALQGRGAIYDANGNLIEGERLTNYANTLNHNSWAYLNGHFQSSEQGKPEGFKGLDLLTITGFNEGIPIFSRVPLKACLETDCWADVTPESLNEQGLPTKKSPIEDRYEAGKTAYFGYPRNGAVASFSSVSYWAGLVCDGYPACRSGSLGVFASTEGTSVAENKQ